MIAFLAGEDRAHYEAAKTLVERVLGEHIPWFDGHLQWRGPGEDQPWFPLKDALRRAKAAGREAHGHFGGEAGLPEARQVRAQLLLWKKLALQLARAGDEVVLGVIVRDVDRRPERRAGAEQARQTVSCPFAVLLGFCVPEAEGWYLCAFSPEDAAERERLAALTGELGFSPCAEPDRLTSTKTASERDAKKVLDRLCGDDRERRARCLAIPLAELRERGARSGLADFLQELETHAVPAVGRPSRR